MNNSKDQKIGPGGDGGKVFIFARKIKGSGKILADGGGGSVGGKGGEVSVVADENQYTGEVSAQGGKSDNFSSNNEKINWQKWGTIFTIVGVIVALIIWYWPNKSNDLTERSNSLPISVYDLFNNSSSFSGTSIEFEDFFKKYIGLDTIAEGYVKDVFRNQNGQIGVLIAKEQNYGFSLICMFGSDQSKVATALPKEGKIKFFGIVNSFSIGIILTKCELK